MADYQPFMRVSPTQTEHFEQGDSKCETFWQSGVRVGLPLVSFILARGDKNGRS